MQTATYLPSYVAQPAPPPRRLFSISQFCERNPAFTEEKIRNLIQYDTPRVRMIRGRRVEVPSNGFGLALVRLGRRIFIDEDKFFEWIELQQKGGTA